MGDVETPARMAWELWLYWWLRGTTTTAALRRERRSSAARPPRDVHGRAALAAATMAFAMDDVDAAEAGGCAPTTHAADDPAILSNAIAGEGLVALVAGDLPVARGHFEEAVVHAEAGGAEVEWTWALAHIWLGTVALLGGDADEAVRLIEAGLGSARRRDDRLTSYIALYNLFQVELGRGDHTAARRHLEEGTRLSLETGDQANLAYLLDAGAVLAAAAGQHARVPLLLGAAQSIREALGSHGYGYYRPDPATIEAAAADARTHLGSDRYDDALDTGRGLSATEAAAMLGDATASRLTRTDAPAHHPYTSGCPWCAGPRGPRVVPRHTPVPATSPRSRHEHRVRHAAAHPDAPAAPPPRQTSRPRLGPRRHRRGSPRHRRRRRQRPGERRLRRGPRRGPGRHHRPAVRPGAADPRLPHRDDDLVRPAGASSRPGCTASWCAAPGRTASCPASPSPASASSRSPSSSVPA